MDPVVAMVLQITLKMPSNLSRWVPSSVVLLPVTTNAVRSQFWTTTLYLSWIEMYLHSIHNWKAQKVHNYKPSVLTFCLTFWTFALSDKLRGSLSRYAWLTILIISTENDLVPRRQCCIESGSANYCNLYTQRRPQATCEGYEAVRQSKWFW